MKRYCYIFILLSAVVVMHSCKDNYGDFNIAESGLQYRFVESHENAQLPQIGNVLELEYSYEKEDGTVLFNSREGGRKYMKTLEKPAHTGGSIEDGLAMMHEGDSALFKIKTVDLLGADTVTK